VLRTPAPCGHGRSSGAVGRPPLCVSQPSGADEVRGVRLSVIDGWGRVEGKAVVCRRRRVWNRAARRGRAAVRSYSRGDQDYQHDHHHKYADERGVFVHLRPCIAMQSGRKPRRVSDPTGRLRARVSRVGWLARGGQIVISPSHPYGQSAYPLVSASAIIRRPLMRGRALDAQR